MFPPVHHEDLTNERSTTFREHGHIFFSPEGGLAARMQTLPLLQAQPSGRGVPETARRLLVLGLTLGNPLPATAWALYSGPRTPAPPYPLCVRFWVSGRRSPSPRNRTRARAERDFDIPTAPGAPRAPPSSGGVARRQLQRPRARCGRWEGRRGGPG